MLWERVRGVSRCSHCTETSNRGWVPTPETPVQCGPLCHTPTVVADEVGSHYKTPQKLILHWALWALSTAQCWEAKTSFWSFLWSETNNFLLPKPSHKPKSFVQTAGKSHLFQIFKNRPTTLIFGSSALPDGSRHSPVWKAAIVNVPFSSLLWHVATSAVVLWYPIWWSG